MGDIIVMAKRTSLRLAKPTPKPNPIIQSSPAPQQSTSATQIQRAVDNPTSETLTPDVIQSLQRTHGNQVVQRLIMRANRPAATVQRAGRMRRIGDSLEDDPGVLDAIGTFGDYLGTDPTQGLGANITGVDNGTGTGATGLGQQTGGNVISVATGALGTGINIYGMVKNVGAWQEANEGLKTHEPGYKGDGTTPGDKELFATVELLKRKRLAAQKGTAESAGGILGGISGLINGIAGFFSSAAAGVVAGTAFAAGAGLGALVGTINAIRDFFNVHKRRKGQKSVQNVINAYISLAAPLSATVSNKKPLYEAAVQDGLRLQGEKTKIEQATRLLVAAFRAGKRTPEMFTKAQQIKQLTQDNDDAIQTVATRISTLGDEVRDAEQEFDKIDKMRVALATSKRKMGYKGKITSGITNLVSAGGAAALFAAAVGAGAAAGPVGWVLSGLAIVAALSFFIGMKIKRSIRKSNVTRMNAELLLVGEYINSGTIAGTASPGASPTVDERKMDTWKRDMFTGKGGVTEKGWFNKLISKKKSGTLKIGERKTELEVYLAKYDKDKAGETIIEGFTNALKPGAEGNQMVDNPKFDATKAPGPNNVQKITLRETIENLLKHFFGDKADDMKLSLLSTNPQKSGEAKKLIMQKMKLG
jgi:hypothetical protein